MGGEVAVDPATLDAKAVEIRQPIGQGPGQTQPPCALEVAAGAADELNKSAKALRDNAGVGQIEAIRLSEAFKSAATAYREVDEQRRRALEQGAGASAPESVVPAAPTTQSLPTPSPPGYQCPASPGVMLEQAAYQINSGDQAASLGTFQAEWQAYATKLDALSQSFGTNAPGWEGDAADAAYASLQKYQQWLTQMATASRQLAQQAGDLAQVHQSAVGEHPTVAQVAALDASIMASTGINPALLIALYEKRQEWQHLSESILQKYASGAAQQPPTIPELPRISALPAARAGGANGSGSSASSGGGGGAPGGGGSGGSGNGDGSQGKPSTSGVPSVPTNGSGSPTSGSPEGSSPGSGSGSGGGSPSGGGGSPSGGAGSGAGAGGGTPSLPDLGGGSGSGLPSLDDPSLKPASAGGGSGGGSGGGGMGSMPLQPNVGGVSVGPGAGGAPVGGGAGGGPGGGGSAGGGMGGGMGGMGHGGGHGQGGPGEKKRTPGLTPDEDLYKEDRAWTEAVIGNRPRRKDTGDAKDTK